MSTDAKCAIVAITIISLLLLLLICAFIISNVNSIETKKLQQTFFQEEYLLEKEKLELEAKKLLMK